MKYTTATFAIAMSNIIPAMTFLMAWICRLEKVNIKKKHSIGKIIGTLVTVGRCNDNDGRCGSYYWFAMDKRFNHGTPEPMYNPHKSWRQYQGLDHDHCCLSVMELLLYCPRTMFPQWVNIRWVGPIRILSKAFYISSVYQITKLILS